MKISVFQTVQFIYLFMAVSWRCPCWEHIVREIASGTLHFQKHFSYSEILWCHNFCDKLCCAFPAEGAEGLKEQGRISFWFLQVLYWSNFIVKYTLKCCHLSSFFFFKFTNPFVYRSLLLNKLKALFLKYNFELYLVNSLKN